MGVRSTLKLRWEKTLFAFFTTPINYPKPQKLSTYTPKFGCVNGVLSFFFFFQTPLNSLPNGPPFYCQNNLIPRPLPPTQVPFHFHFDMRLFHRTRETKGAVFFFFNPTCKCSPRAAYHDSICVFFIVHFFFLFFLVMTFLYVHSISADVKHVVCNKKKPSQLGRRKGNYNHEFGIIHNGTLLICELPH